MKLLNDWRKKKIDKVKKRVYTQYFWAYILISFLLGSILNPIPTYSLAQGDYFPLFTNILGLFGGLFLVMYISSKDKNFLIAFGITIALLIPFYFMNTLDNLMLALYLFASALADFVEGAIFALFSLGITNRFFLRKKLEENEKKS